MATQLENLLQVALADGKQILLKNPEVRQVRRQITTVKLTGKREIITDFTEERIFSKEIREEG